MKHVILFFIIIASALITRAQSEYIVYSAKGDVAVSNNSGGWDKVGHLDRLSSSSNIRIGQGGELKIYSKSLPDSQNQYHGRAPATPRRKRGCKGSYQQAHPSNRPYREWERPRQDHTIGRWLPLACRRRSYCHHCIRSHNPSKSDDYCISATNIGDGLKGIILTNNGKAAVAAAAIVVDNGRYTPLNISGDFAKPGVIELPAASSYTVPNVNWYYPKGQR